MIIKWHEKFLQNAVLKQRLIGSDNCVLAECAVHDRVWGIGLNMKHEDSLDMSKWKGQNLLGFTLRKARELMKI